MTKQEQRKRAYEIIANDFNAYAPNCLRIVPKAGGLVPFRPNLFQKYVHYHAEKQLATRGYVRTIILKPRQLGCSTYIQGRFYHKVTFRRGVLCFIVCHEDKATSNLFRMAKTFHENCPEEVKPQTRASNAIELVFDNDKGTGLKSRYIIQTAAGKGGRSFTPRYVHFSEYAFYSDKGMETVGAIQAAMPREEESMRGTEIFIETTANGMGGPFHEKWQSNREMQKDGLDPEYVPVFFPWYWHPPYRMSVSDTEKQHILESLNEDEKWLMAQRTLREVPGGFKVDGPTVTVEQIKWRRVTINDLEPPVGMSKEDFFRQEYPATEDEAFVHSGDSVFPTAHIKVAEEECYEPLKTGELNFASGKFEEKPNGRLKIWELPKRDKLYVIGADVAEGLAHGDYSCADVLIVPSGRQVAQWHGHIGPDLYGDLLCHLGYFYGALRPALIGVEANNHGHTTIDHVVSKSYPQIYMRDAIDGPQGKKVKRHGFLSTKSTKYFAIDLLAGDLRDGNSGIVSFDTISELRTYANDNGKYGAAPGCFDDRVMSRAIAGVMLREMPQVQRIKRQGPKGYKHESV
jgi:hypothetical protein